MIAAWRGLSGHGKAGVAIAVLAVFGMACNAGGDASSSDRPATALTPTPSPTPTPTPSPTPTPEPTLASWEELVCATQDGVPDLMQAYADGMQAVTDTDQLRLEEATTRFYTTASGFVDVLAARLDVVDEALDYELALYDFIADGGGALIDARDAETWGEIDVSSFDAGVEAIERLTDEYLALPSASC